jgi:hypothetical protein
MDFAVVSGGVVERIDGEPFAMDERPLVTLFHFDMQLIDSPKHRFVYACVTCDAGVVLRGVVQHGEVTCNRCHALMVTGCGADA